MGKNNNKKMMKEVKKNKDSLKFQKNGLLKRDRKILEKAGVEYSLKMKGDARGRTWQKQFLENGFDMRDTWNLDITMLELLLERLWLYREIAPVDLTFHKVKVGKSEVTIEVAVDELIEDLKKLLGETDKYSLDKEEQKEWDKLQRRVWRIWGVVSPYVWW